MTQLLGLILISFAVTSLLLVPFIDFLFYLKKKGSFKNEKLSQQNELLNADTPIHHLLLVGKDSQTPIGGGLLLIPVVSILSFLVLKFTNYPMDNEFYILIFSLLSFGLIGFLDDAKKLSFSQDGKYKGLRGRYILALQILFASVLSLLLFYSLGLNNIFIPLIGNVILGYWYIPLSAFLIIAFANAYNISDGLDGLSTGLLMICLFAFLVLANAVFNLTISVFVGVWIGAILAYLYFNVFPARVYLGDAGAYGFGATLAVIGLLSGKILGLGIIGGVYIIIVGSSLIQIFSKKIFKRKLLPVAPIHMYFKYIGWEEPKIVMRFWLAGAVFAIIGLWLSLLSH